MKDGAITPLWGRFMFVIFKRLLFLYCIIEFSAGLTSLLTENTASIRLSLPLKLYIEFHRITNQNVPQSFYVSLAKYTPLLLKLYIRGRLEVLARDDAAPQDLAQCNTCKRSFRPKVLEKHAIICQKSATKKRKVFDSSKQRAEGTDIPIPNPIKPKAENPKTPSNYRVKHEDFTAPLQSWKTPTKYRGPRPPPPPHEADYIQCPSCQRTFNKSAADRHIKFCQEKAARNPNKSQLAEVNKTPGRTQYKPPTPAKKANSPSTPPIPSASSHSPQRSGLGQPTGIPAGKVSSAGLVRTNPSGSTGAVMKTPAASSSHGSVRNAHPGVGLNKKTVGNNVSRRYPDRLEEDGDERELSKFCLSCSSKYPVESAVFCCECGVRRMRI